MHGHNLKSEEILPNDALILDTESWHRQSAADLKRRRPNSNSSLSDSFDEDHQIPSMAQFDEFTDEDEIEVLDLT